MCDEKSTRITTKSTSKVNHFNSPIFSCRLRQIFEFVSCKMWICSSSVLNSLLLSSFVDVCFCEFSSLFGESLSELPTRQGSLNLNYEKGIVAIHHDNMRMLHVYLRCSIPSKSSDESVRWFRLFKLTTGGRLAKSEWLLNIALPNGVLEYVDDGCRYGCVLGIIC